jgi:hypothetical protein
MPLLKALAFSVVFMVIAIGEEYNCEESDGSVPSVVNLISAPDVAVVRDTFCAAAYTPPPGAMLGEETVPAMEMI